MDRRKFLQAGAVGAAGLVVPAVAEGKRRKMGSRFNRRLHLTRGGGAVIARGPLDADAAAYVAVVVVQGKRQAHGMSHRYHASDVEWQSVAHVAPQHEPLRPGPAVAHGVQVSLEGDEAYTYAWSMPVTLV